MVSVSGPVKETKVSEEDIRSILKGLEPTAEVVSWNVWYYPLYEIALSSVHGDRRLYLDGIGGKVAPLRD
jgi:hypothetical protein